MFLYSFYFILRLRLRVSYFPFNIGQTIRNSKSSFQFPGEGQSPLYKTELNKMKRTYQLYCYCTKSSNGAHNTGISHAHVSFINLSWADKSATSMFIMFILVSALRNNSFIEFKLIKREEKFFARRSNKEKSFYPSRVYN